MFQAQEDRNQVLEAAAESGVIRNYTAWRQSLKGKRFQIKDATLFNLETPTEKKVQFLSDVQVPCCKCVLRRRYMVWPDALQTQAVSSKQSNDAVRSGRTIIYPDLTLSMDYFAG